MNKTEAAYVCYYREMVRDWGSYLKAIHIGEHERPPGWAVSWPTQRLTCDRQNPNSPGLNLHPYICGRTKVQAAGHQCMHASGRIRSHVILANAAGRKQFELRPFGQQQRGPLTKRVATLHANSSRF